MSGAIMGDEALNHLDLLREQIDRIDQQILGLLQDRNHVVADIVTAKRQQRQPVYVAEREQQKTRRFRDQAVEHGLEPDWAEDFLRMIMAASRASQSQQSFVRAGQQQRRILFIGGDGSMATLYRKMFERSGHHTLGLDRDNWQQLDDLLTGTDLVIVSVPINVTLAVISRLHGKLPQDCILADFTSNKSDSVAAMLQAHSGPVIGLHPMHGADVSQVSRQLLIACPARHPEQSAWLLEQCHLWGMRVISTEAKEHDRMMNLVQGLRHFIALLHGSYLQRSAMDPAAMLSCSSPIYRAELMMIGRMFAQQAELYADIVLANEERRQLLADFLQHHARLAELVANNDRAGFIAEFESISRYFGDFSQTAMSESSYMIHRLADRFA
ncbi:MAG: bifunctional chorismate mutase/prephenate dehydrogenase [Gammaproteobacteria bacterium]|jgi:chorismate mutase/prephenate dehydrogenase|nr:bifunctional chorismate mutase/prephenate dehydrogenase [Gammaproteobacteria bacterium]